jgi:hypothetical protein
MRAEEFVYEYKNYTIKDYEDIPYDPGFPAHLLQGVDKHIGPHEGKTLGLMLSGMKPAALVSNKQLPMFKEYINAGKIIKLGKLPGKHSQYIIALPNGVERGKKLLELFPKMWEARDSGDEETARKLDAYIGLCLGYPKESIRRFLNTRYR